ncbi:Uncharacterised protein [Enterobacter cloacae]|nr:Uncharacterised protein [Enterobacter cloacae]
MIASGIVQKLNAQMNQTLLQIILDEVRSAKKAGINMQQTDHYLVGVIDRYQGFEGQ